jgi:furin
MARMAVKRLIAFLVLAGFYKDSYSVSYNNEWAAEIPGGLRKAREVADHTGCSLQFEIIPDTGIYQFKCHHVRRRSTEPDLETHSSLEDHEHVNWCSQQEVKSRQKRQYNWPGLQNWGFPQSQGGGRRRTTEAPFSYSGEPFENPLNLNDQRFPLMWYLNRGGGNDMNVQGAWQQGITGKGIVVTILDDGVERTNPDLVENYDPMASYDVNDNDGDPSPRYDLTDSNRHGTRCAGEVSASANNSMCAVGVAYNSRIGGVRMLDGDVTDAVEARSISLNNQHIHIYSASWGPDDDGKTVDGPGRLAKQAFIKGIESGRNGKGSIFVWASGNGGKYHDNCNCDGYTNSIWTLSVSSATENGLIPWYSESCSSTMATTYSSGSSGERKVVTTDLHDKCTSTHTGTSASAPMAAGVIALVLEANPSLTWRDVQHITVRNCRKANLRATDWAVNAMGRDFSHSFGYGIMDATAMVNLAKEWTNAPQQQTYAVKANIGQVSIPPSSSRTAKMEVTEAGDVKFLEHVQAHVSLSSARRGDMQLFLISPSGTKSQLLKRRPHDMSPTGFQDWPFLTVFSWGENPIGTWTLELQNDGRYMANLHDWSLTLYGTRTDPEPAPQQIPQSPAIQQPNPVQEPVIAADSQLSADSPPSPPPQPIVYDASPSPAPLAMPVKQAPPSNDEAPLYPSMEPFHSAMPETSAETSIPNCMVQITSAFCKTCVAGYLALNGRCVTSCPQQGYYQARSNMSDHCFQCYYTCETCTGSNDYQCLSCYGDAQIEITPGGESYCHNKNLIFKVFSTSRWYYILSLGFLINTILIILLLVYIYRRKNKASSGLYRGDVLDRVISPSGKGYKKVLPSTSAYHDDSDGDSPSNNKFLTHYSDNPNDKPYRDDDA